MIAELTHVSAALRLEIIDNFSDWKALEPEWWSLVKQLPSTTPFQLPAWLYTWWSHFGNGRLRVFALRENHALRGIVPCFLHEWEGLRQITLIGSGVSDYLEPPVESGNRSLMIEQMRQYLAETPDWDVCNWQDLAHNTLFREMRSGDGLDVQMCADTPCTRIPLAGSFDEFSRGLPKHLRGNLRRDRQKAERGGTVEFSVRTSVDTALISTLISLHAARWARQGMPGMVVANSSVGFLRDVANRLVVEDMLRLFTLRYRGEIAAIIFGIAYRNTLYNYLTAFDPEHEALGLGRTLLYESVRYTFENEFSAWDFLRGDERYKFWWGAELEPKSRVIVTRAA